MVSNTGDIPGTSGGGSFQTSLGSTRGDGSSFDREGKIDVVPEGDLPVQRKLKRGKRTRSFYKEPGRAKMHKRGAKRQAKRRVMRRSSRR